MNGVDRDLIRSRFANASMSPVEKVLAQLPDHRKSGSGWSAKCPAHDDRLASLSVSTGDEGCVLVHCHAGCTIDSVFAALSLTKADLFPPRTNGHNGNGRNQPTNGQRKIVKTYDYPNIETAELKFQKIRYEPKGFNQRRPGVNGTWIYNLDGVTPQLYKFPELCDADPNETVYLVEGEKTVEALMMHGLIATCGPNGAAKFAPECVEQLRARHVVILPDNDKPGQDFSKKTAALLQGVAASVRILDLPGLPPKGDAFDFLQKRSADEIVALAKSAPAPAAERGGENARSVRDLIREFPALRPPVIHGLCRRGETMNVIAPSKTGKSWLVIDLAIAVATGRPWLGQFMTVKGDVLIIDNELHGETCANRIPKVAAARGITIDEFADHLFVENVRGRLRDLFWLEQYFSKVEPGRYKVVILDAFYRFLPQGSDENDNGTVASLYNFLDRLADRLGCCFVLIHHSTKGSQAEKSVTDVGAGAGSQARATDCHLILRQHETDDVVVIDAAVRSWAPIDPMCLKWEFPLWTPDDSLDPTQLRRPGKRAKAIEIPPAEPAITWSLETFVGAFMGETPKTEPMITVAAEAMGLSERKASRLLKAALDSRLIYRWTFSDRTQPHKFSTIEQPVFATGDGSKL